MQMLICKAFVEHRGVEPLTSTMRMSRATNCANAPNLVSFVTIFYIGRSGHNFDWRALQSEEFVLPTVPMPHVWVPEGFPGEFPAFYVCRSGDGAHWSVSSGTSKLSRLRRPNPASLRFLCGTDDSISQWNGKCKLFLFHFRAISSRFYILGCFPSLFFRAGPLGSESSARPGRILLVYRQRPV